MLHRLSRLLPRFILAAAIGGFIILCIPLLVASQFARPYLYTVESVPSSRVAIVFGAGLTRSGTPSSVLRDRVEVGVQLYKAGKVEKLLMSGDNRFVDYNEPAAMLEYAVSLGVPEEDIVQDFAGRRTYDTCYRARHIFGIQNAILVTQSFHITRALFTCNNLGVESTGTPSDIRHFSRRLLTYWHIREIPATAVALWEVWVTRPLPVLGQPEFIFSGETGGPLPAKTAL